MKHKTIDKQECHEYFKCFLHCFVDNFNSSSFTFVPKDVLGWENMLKKHNGKYPQSHVRSMSYYLNQHIDEVQTIDGIRYKISVFKPKDRRKKVYKLEVYTDE